MKWKKFKIKTVTDAEDIIISTLYDIGLEGAQIEDKVPLTALGKGADVCRHSAGRPCGRRHRISELFCGRKRGRQSGIKRRACDRSADAAKR